ERAKEHVAHRVDASADAEVDQPARRVAVPRDHPPAHDIGGRREGGQGGEETGCIARIDGGGELYGPTGVPARGAVLGFQLDRMELPLEELVEAEPELAGRESHRRAVGGPRADEPGMRD